MNTSVADETEVEDTRANARQSKNPSSVQRKQGVRVDYKDQAKSLMERCITDARQNTARLDRDRQDWQNHLMKRGGQNQWMVYDRATASYVPRGSDPEQGGLPDWVPRPATNIFGVKVDGIASILDQSEPAKEWAPATGDDKDRATAEVAKDADPVLLQEIDYDTLRPILNKLCVLTNGSLVTVFYDNDPRHGMGQIDMLRCPSCGVETLPDELDDAGGVCPGGPDDDEGCGTSADDFEPVIGMDGKPFGVPYAKGKMCASLATSFEYSLPSTARTSRTKHVPWVLTHSSMPVEDIIARWPSARGRIDKKDGNRKGGLQKAYSRSLRQLSAPARANAPVAAGGGGSSSAADDPVVYILHHDPIDDGTFYFPDGLLCVMVDEFRLEGGPLPNRDDDDRPFKPCLTRVYAQGAGQQYAQPPADDMVPLQISRNLVDALIQLIFMHYAAPTRYIPLSVTLETEPTGRPGEDVYYRSTVPGDKPQVEQGTGPTEALFKYLDMIDANFEVLSKLNSVLAGQAPEGDPTLGQVQILQERGMSAFKEPLDELVQFESDLSRMLMWIAKRSAWSDRFRRVHGDNGEWDIRQFNASDLTGKVDVVIEKASAWPKSHLMKMLQLKQALELGILPPPIQDPELQTKLLTEMGLIDLKPSLDHDRKQISRELDRWKAAHDPAEIEPPDPTVIEPPQHLFFKKMFLKTEEFEQLRAANPPLAQAMIGHVQQLQDLVQKAQSRQGEPPKVNYSLSGEDLRDPDARRVFEESQGIPATPPPAAPQEPDSRSSVEKGDRSAVDALVKAGAITPADAQPKQDLVGAAVQAGALTPADAAPQAPAGPSIDDLIGAGAMTPAPPEEPNAPR